MDQPLPWTNAAADRQLIGGLVMPRTANQQHNRFWLGYVIGVLLANLLLWLHIFPRLVPIYEFLYTLSVGLTCGYLLTRQGPTPGKAKT